MKDKKKWQRFAELHDKVMTTEENEMVVEDWFDLNTFGSAGYSILRKRFKVNRSRREKAARHRPGFYPTYPSPKFDGVLRESAIGHYGELLVEASLRDPDLFPVHSMVLDHFSTSTDWLLRIVSQEVSLNVKQRRRFYKDVKETAVSALNEKKVYSELKKNLKKFAKLKSKTSFNKITEDQNHDFYTLLLDLAENNLDVKHLSSLHQNKSSALLLEQALSHIVDIEGVNDSTQLEVVAKKVALNIPFLIEERKQFWKSDRFSIQAGASSFLEDYVGHLLLNLLQGRSREFEKKSVTKEERIAYESKEFLHISRELLLMPLARENSQLSLWLSDKMKHHYKIVDTYSKSKLDDEKVPLKRFLPQLRRTKRFFKMD